MHSIFGFPSDVLLFEVTCYKLINGIPWKLHLLYFYSYLRTTIVKLQILYHRSFVNVKTAKF